MNQKMQPKKKLTGQNKADGTSRKRQIAVAALVVLAIGLAVRALRSNPVDSARQHSGRGRAQVFRDLMRSDVREDVQPVAHAESSCVPDEVPAAPPLTHLDGEVHVG